MKTPINRRLTIRRANYALVIGIFLLIATAALAIASSGSTRPDVRRSEEKTITSRVSSNKVRRFPLAGRTALALSPALAETINTYSADCVSAKSTFFLGETVCAKTDGVDLGFLGGRWVHWLRQDLSIAFGSSTTTLITSNPQAFTFVVDQVGTWKATIAETGDISQTPAVFTVVPAPLATYAAGCVTPQSGFALGDSVCVKLGAEVDPAAGLQVDLINPGSTRQSSVAVTTSEQVITFTLPTATSQTLNPGTEDEITFDNRGTWQLALRSSRDGDVRYANGITVRDANPATNIADLQIAKFYSGTSLVNAGGTLTAFVSVFNYGPDAAQGVQVGDTTPSNTTFLSLVQTNGPAFSCTTPAVSTAGISACTRSSLNRGESAGFLITYQVNTAIGNGADLTGTASASTTTNERTTADNDSSASGTGSNPTPPSCTVSCPGNITVTAAQGQSGATVTFNQPTTSGSCGSVSVVPASGSFFAVGTSVVTASTEDGDTCTFLVTVNAAEDNENPTITCPSDITVDETNPSANSATVTYDVTASDNSGSATVSCTPVSGSSFAIGTNQVTCTATDAAGNSAECTFNVTVNQVGCDLDANSPAPTPNVASLPTITRSCSATLLAADDPSATDACEGTINGEITHVNGQPSNDRTFDAPGTYVVTWTYTDAAGHSATQDQSIVILADNLAPVANVATLPTVTGECSVTLTPPTATDNCAGTVEGTTGSLLVEGAGTHTVVWTYDDGRGNTSQQNQTVVITDTEAPVVTLTGPSTITVECHTSYTDAGATANDNCLGSMTPTSNSNVDVNTPGTYQVVWSATDAGNNTGSATRTVNVVDTTAPVITLTGANPMTVILGSTFTDPGATANDTCAAAFAATPSGTVNTNAIGTYTITYNATDPSGNPATAVTRTVNVIYSFTGFFSPVSNTPTLNSVNAGRGIPVKFSLSGNQGLNIFAANNPYSVSLNCSNSDPGVDVVETVTAGGSSLSYSPDTYTYVWKTESSWAGTCRQLVVTLNDGTVHTANFKFK